MTISEKTKIVQATIDEYNLTICHGWPCKKKLQSLISLIDNTILCVTESPGISGNLASLRMIRDKVYEMYLKYYGNAIFDDCIIKVYL